VITAALILLGVAIGAALGAGVFYAVDRVTFLWGSTTREMRHAGWRARRRRA
jgi:hypothetical protein